MSLYGHTSLNWFLVPSHVSSNIDHVMNNEASFTWRATGDVGLVRIFQFEIAHFLSTTMMMALTSAMRNIVNDNSSMI